MQCRKYVVYFNNKWVECKAIDNRYNGLNLILNDALNTVYAFFLEN